MGKRLEGDNCHPLPDGASDDGWYDLYVDGLSDFNIHTIAKKYQIISPIRTVDALLIIGSVMKGLRDFLHQLTPCHPDFLVFSLLRLFMFTSPH